MSRSSRTLVVGIVGEGPTDYTILSAILRKLWSGPVEALPLQPTTDASGFAVGPSGSSGVKFWCKENASRLSSLIDPAIGDPLDVLLICLDVDAAISAGIENPPKKTSAYDAKRLKKTIRSWIEHPQTKKVPQEVVVSTPAMAMEAWVVAALFAKPARPQSLSNPAYFLVTQGRLEMDPRRKNKVRKPPETYATFARAVAAKLGQVRSRCVDAEMTCREIELLARKL